MEPLFRCLIIFIYGLSLYLSGDATILRNLNEGDVCNPINPNWTCKRLDTCPTAFKEIRIVTSQVCGSNGSTLVVCCEPSSESKTPSMLSTNPETTRARALRQTKDQQILKSAQKCEEYAKYVYKKLTSISLSLYGGKEVDEEIEDTCYRAQTPLIVGGNVTEPREFPHQVNIGYRYGSRKKWLCTGTLISETYVLSAAHCSRLGSYGVPKYAVIGDLDIASDTDIADPEERLIIEIINHLDYEEGSGYNDIALYRLDKSVTLNSYRRPACLNTDSAIKDESAIATGWGNIKKGGPRSSQLLKVRLNLISHDVCSRHWPPKAGLKRGIDNDTMLCAGHLQEEKDTCQGDSGGPLQVKLNSPYCMHSIIGITSFGEGCAEKKPAIYTRVSHYIDWIEKIVWP